jgi:formate-dependent nitrite reductase membrane component NrfD
MVSKVDQVYLAGDANGGLVKVQVLNAALNNLQTEINTLKALTGTAITVYSGILDSGASAAAFNAAVLPQINISQIENTTVKHGNG